MSPAGGYPIEEFLEAITAQLDQTQDALRLKAVNRPLTFALKDFNVDLKVFVEMDQDGRVNFRPAAPNEEGASTVSIGFTTITRPMIEENTISMEMAAAPPLDELGLEPAERRQLERVGVRTGAQLRKLEQNASDEGLARHTGVNLGRIRSALNLARPRLNEVVDPEAGAQAGSAPVAPDTVPNIDFQPPAAAPSPAAGNSPDPGPHQPRPGRTPLEGVDPRPQFSPEFQPEFQPHIQPQIQPQPQPQLQPSVAPDRGPSGLVGAGLKPRHRLEVGSGARKLDLRGRNLLDSGKTPVAKLDGQRLKLLAAHPSAVSFALPDGWALGPGRLLVEMPDGAMEDFDLSGGAGS